MPLLGSSQSRRRPLRRARGAVPTGRFDYRPFCLPEHDFILCIYFDNTLHYMLRCHSMILSALVLETTTEVWGDQFHPGKSSYPTRYGLKAIQFIGASIRIRVTIARFLAICLTNSSD